VTGAFSVHDAAHDDVSEDALQLGTAPPDKTSLPQHLGEVPEHSPVNRPPSVPFDPTQSSALPLVGHAPPSTPLDSQVAE
jgi:hypothetical protein